MTDSNSHGSLAQLDERESYAAELALASLLLSFGGHAGASYLYDTGFVPDAAIKENIQKQKNDFREMSKLYNQRYASPVTPVPAPEGMQRGVDAYGEVAYSQPPITLTQGQIPNRGHSSSFHKTFSRSGQFEPHIAVNPRRTAPTMAHEFGHAAMGARVHRQNAGLLDDPIAWAQEKRMPQAGGWGFRSLSTPGEGWRKFLPLLPLAVGSVTGLPLGPELGAGLGAATGALANLPLLAVEAEAWRRGEDYARAAGVPRREYYRKAVAPFLTYLMLAGRNIGLGAGGGALAGLLTHPEEA